MADNRSARREAQTSPPRPLGGVQAQAAAQPMAVANQTAQPRRRRRTLRSTVAVAIASVPWAVQAQAQALEPLPASVTLPPVAVQAPSLAAACPTLAADLQDALGPVIQDRGVGGHTAVSLRHGTGTLNVVNTVGGPLAYQRVVKRVVRRAACDLPAGQVASFGLRYVDPWGQADAAVASPEPGADGVFVVAARSR